MRRLTLPIDGGRVRLRLPTREGARPWYAILTAPSVRRVMLPDRPWTLAKVRAKIDRARSEARRGTSFELVVERSVTAQVIGRVALKNVVRGNERRAEVAYWTSPNFWGQGLTGEGVRALLRAGFEELGLHRVEAEVLVHNERSIHLLGSLGFRPEGLMREAMYDRGEWISMIRFGLLAHEFRREPARSARRRSSRTG